MGKTFEALENGNVQDILPGLIAGQKALRWFIYAMNKDGQQWNVDAAEGLFFLQSQQDELLEEVLEAVTVKDILLNEYREQIAAGEKVPVATARAVSLREEFIAAKSEAGEAPGDIASAMNMKRASIEKVIRRLRGQDEPHTQQAVNG